MGIPIIGDIFDTVGDLVGKIIPDKDLKRRLDHEFKMLEDKMSERAHQEALAQMEVNKAEAQHKSIFVAGWRPFIGWVSGVGIAWTFMLAPFVEFVARLFGWVGDMPSPDTGLLVSLVLAMLGSSGLRTYEKIKGVARADMDNTKPVTFGDLRLRRGEGGFATQQSKTKGAEGPAGAPWNR